MDSPSLSPFGAHRSASETARPGCRIRADRGDAAERLDRVLVRHLAGVPEASRTKIQHWIAEGRVEINGRVVRRPSERLAAGDRLDVALPPPPEPRPRPAAETRPLTVLFEDPHFLAVDKPPGWRVHPTPGRRSGTLLNALLGSGYAWQEDRPRLVQRLDRDTSGVLLVATSREAHAGLARALTAPGAAKEYLAVVYGVPSRDKGRIELSIARDPAEPRRRLASKRGGLPAATDYRVLAVSPGAGVRLTLLACRLETGRTHQIRVHLAAAGLPLVGDPLYGEPRWKGIADPTLAVVCRDFPRQALHARRVVFQHPDTGERLEIRAPLPKDLIPLLEAASLREP